MIASGRALGDALEPSRVVLSERFGRVDAEESECIDLAVRDLTSMVSPSTTWMTSTVHSEPEEGPTPPRSDVVEVVTVLVSVSVSVSVEVTVAVAVCVRVRVGLVVDGSITVAVDVAVAVEGEGEGNGVEVVPSVEVRFEPPVVEALKLVAALVVVPALVLLISPVVVSPVPADPPHPARIMRQTRTRIDSGRRVRGVPLDFQRDPI